MIMKGKLASKGNHDCTNCRLIILDFAKFCIIFIKLPKFVVFVKIMHVPWYRSACNDKK